MDTTSKSAIFISEQGDLLKSVTEEFKTYNHAYALSPDQLVNTALAPSHIDLVFYHTDGELNVHTLDRVHVRYPDSEIFILQNSQFHHQLDLFSSRPWLRHYLSCLPSFDLQEFIHLYKLKLKQHRFGLKSFFPGENDTLYLDIYDSQKKDHYTETCLAFLEPRLNSLSKARLGNVLEELIMNMIWDAPRHEDGEPLFNKISRKKSVLLEEHQKGRLAVTVNDQHIGISAEDPFGAISLEVILTHLSRCFFSREEKDTNSAGAGLGLYMIYKCSEVFNVNVHPGHRTEFIILLPLRIHSKEHQRQKSFHFNEVSYE